jgi:hypothetical protein
MLEWLRTVQRMVNGVKARKRLRNGWRKNAGYFQVRDGFVMNVTPIL